MQVKTKSQKATLFVALEGYRDFIPAVKMSFARF